MRAIAKISIGAFLFLAGTNFAYALVTVLEGGNGNSSISTPIIYAHRNSIQYFSSLALSLIITIIVATCIKLIFKSKLSRLVLLITVLYYLVTLFIPVEVAPKFMSIFEEMRVSLPPPTALLLSLTNNSMSIFIYTLLLAIFSPVITEQLYSKFQRKYRIIIRIFVFIFVCIMLSFFIVSMFLPIFD